METSKNIIQWNLNGFHNKIDEIKLIINQHNPIAICIQETNIKIYHLLPNIKKYTNASKNRSVYNRASGGVDILIHTSYP
jgi:exonuclease III